MNLSIEKTRKTLLNNQEFIKKIILEDYEEHSFKSQKGSILTLSSDYDDNDITIDLANADSILNLGYDSILKFIKKSKIITPLPKITEKNDICNRMIDFAKDVVKFDTDDYQVRLTDGDGDEDSYYIVSFMENEKYRERKEYLDKDLRNFKVASKINIIFQLDEYPKAYLNLTGSYFYDSHGTNEELLRGLFLSYYYFANVKFQD